MLRVQASPACNLNCSYCYIPASVRRQTSVMSMQVLETLLRRLVDEDLLEDRLAISWHGAEPLVVGVAWYEEALEQIAEVLGGTAVQVSQVFQTNGVLIDDAWCEYFARTGAHVGVSLDGAAAQNAARVNWGGRPAHGLAMRGVAALNRHAIPWALLAVVTEETMRDPEAFIAFVRDSGCAYLGFKVEETNVAHVSHLAGLGGLERLYADFVLALWRAFPAGGPVRVREFEDYRGLRGGPPAQVIPVTLVPFRNLTVAVNGDFTIFAGELLFRDDDRFVFGNVMDGPLLDCLKTARFQAVAAQMLAGARRCAATCERYVDCGSFYISQKYAETGSFDAGETLACRLEVKTFLSALDGGVRLEAGADSF